MRWKKSINVLSCRSSASSFCDDNQAVSSPTATNNYKLSLPIDPTPVQNNVYAQPDLLLSLSNRSSTTTTTTTTPASNNYKGLGTHPEQTIYTAHSSARCLDSHASLAELEMRLRSLHKQLGLQGSSSNSESPPHRDSQRSAERMRSLGICDSSKTLDESTGIDNMLRQASSSDEQHAARLDLCGWIRHPKNNAVPPAISAVTVNEGGRKPNFIYRRNKSQVSERPSNLTQQKTGDTFKTVASDTTIQPKPSCPTEIAKLLSEFSKDCGLISSFMSENEDSMEPLVQYVLEDAHFMPSSPGVVAVNDQTAHYLPPLAAEEYAAHISRITYFVRTLQALEVADPGYLSNPYARQLIELLFDLERAITLPRVDFLRRHAETVHAMHAVRSQPRAQQSDTILAIGNADEWVDLDTDVNAKRILNMARSIPRHPDLRSSTANTSQRNRQKAMVGSLPGQSTCDGSILGDRLRPDSGLCSDVFMESSNDPLTTHADTTALRTGDIDALAQSEAYRATASTPEFSAIQFHPKLHPVVEPCPMDVSNPWHTGKSSKAREEGKRPNRLYR